MSVVTLPGNMDALLRTQNFSRQAAGMPQMAAPEVEQFRMQIGEQQRQQAQVEQLDALLDDQEIAAEELARSLRDAGLSAEAERFRRASQRRAFNVARRGLAGGSADAEAQAELAAQTQQQQQEITAQAEQQLISDLLASRSQRDKLMQEVVKQNPALATQDLFRTQGIQQEAADTAAIRQAQRAIDQARAGRAAGIGGAVGGTLGNLGSVAAGALIGSA